MKQLGTVLLMLAVLTACNRKETKTPAGDLQFATTASMANLYEIESGKLALEKATGETYRKFAVAMVQQHGEIGRAFAPIAKAQGLPLPAQLDGDFKQLYDALVQAPAGNAFDALYRQQMVATHEAAVPLFVNEGTSGLDPALKAFASQWAPTIKHHLQMANELPVVQ